MDLDLAQMVYGLAPTLIAGGAARAVWGVLAHRNRMQVELARIGQARAELHQVDRPPTPTPVRRPAMAAPIIEGEIVPPRAPSVDGTGAELALPGLTTLGQVLARGFQPSRDAILLALGPGGQLITTSLKGLVHVLMIGPTGVGKSNITRVIFPQVAALPGVETEWWNPHYMPVDQDTGEEWWQMAQATTRGAPLTDTYEIMAALEALACGELEARKVRGRHGQHVGPPRFHLIDEVPVLSADRRFMEWAGMVLREGRKYGLFLMMASQDAQVKTLGGSSGMRMNAQTVFYGGGDRYSASNLFGSAPPDPPGRGVIYLKSTATPTIPLVRVPLAENADLNLLLESVIGYQDGYQPATVPPVPDRPDVAKVKPFVADVAVSEAAIQAYLSFLAGDDAAKITEARTGIPSSKGGAFQAANKETQQLIREGARAFLVQGMEG